MGKNWPFLPREALSGTRRVKGGVLLTQPLPSRSPLIHALATLLPTHVWWVNGSHLHPLCAKIKENTGEAIQGTKIPKARNLG